MKKDFNFFLKNNRSIVKDYQNVKKLLLVDRSRTSNTFYQIFLSKILIDKFKLNHKVITDKDIKYSDHVKLFKSFGFRKFENVFDYKKIIFKEIVISFKSLFITLNVIYKIYRLGFKWLISQFKLENIYLGDLIYDSYIRTELRFINPKIDFHLFNIIFKAVFRTLNLKKIIEKDKINFIIIGTYTYAYNGPITLRLGLEKNIKVLEVGKNVLWKYSKNILTNGYDNILVKEKSKFIKKIK